MFNHLLHHFPFILCESENTGSRQVNNQLIADSTAHKFKCLTLFVLAILLLFIQWGPKVWDRCMSVSFFFHHSFCTNLPSLSSLLPCSGETSWLCRSSCHWLTICRHLCPNSSYMPRDSWEQTTAGENGPRDTRCRENITYKILQPRPTLFCSCGEYRTAEPINTQPQSRTCSERHRMQSRTWAAQCITGTPKNFNG